MAAKKSKRTEHHPRIREYAAYRFRGQYPLYAEAIEVLGDKIDDAQENGGAHRSTVRSWKKKRNRSGLIDTLDATLRTGGYHLEIVKD